MFGFELRVESIAHANFHGQSARNIEDHHNVKTHKQAISAATSIPDANAVISVSSFTDKMSKKQWPNSVFYGIEAFIQTQISRGLC